VDVFLFDEPLSNLDAKLRTDLRIELKRLHKRLGNTMIYVTHDQIEALTLADRVAIMKSGSILQLDSPKGIYHQPQNRFVAEFIGSPSMNFLQGSLLEQDSHWVFAAIDAGNGQSTELRISLDRYRFTERPTAGQRVEFGIRPEHIGLEKSTEDLSTELDFSVELLEPMGSDAVAWGSVASQAFTIKLDADRMPQADTRVQAFFDPGRASIFDADTGLRL
jgi:multiple sugar transport system ATP-binding protein